MKKCFTPKDKLWKVMKLCSIQAVAAMTLCSMAFAHDHYGQVLDKKITISLKEVSLEEALEAIEELTYVKFFYSVDQLGIKEKISVESVDRSLRDILDELLAPYGVEYKIHEKSATITLKRGQERFNPGDSGEGTKPRTFRERAHVATIMGEVTDAATQQPMAGVNIIVKGTTEGTTTNAEGRYTIWAQHDDVLVFSFIGFTTFEIPVNDQTVINVAMTEDITGLEEVEINAGYWNVRKKDQTGNIIRLGAEDIEKHPISDPIAALEGRISGVEIIQTTGVPGGSFSVRIRGQNSIGNGNEPLYIVDGVPYTNESMASFSNSSNIFPKGTSPLNFINPSDIASIEVLKDADATAIYGSRGANGVILITTKRGQKGKTAVNMHFYTGAGKVTQKFDLLNTAEYLQMRNEAFRNEGTVPTVLNAPDLLTWDTTRYTDWQRELIGGRAMYSDAQMSISGGSAETQFLIGGGFHKEGSVFPGDDSNRRLSFHLNLTNSSLDRKFKTAVTMSYSASEINLIERDLTSVALKLPPNAPPLYKPSGELNWDANSYNQLLPHPLAYLQRNFDSNIRNLIGNVVLSYTLLPNLEIKTSLGYTHIDGESVTIIPKKSYYPPVAQTLQNSSSFSNNGFQNWIVEPQINWNLESGKHGLGVSAGTSFLEQISEGLVEAGSGFVSESLMSNLKAASTITISSDRYLQYRYHALFGRINYRFNEKYIVNLTGRRDGSSRFGSNNRFTMFGAVGTAWLFSMEEFITNNLPFLSFGKLRASYGLTGNDQIGDYQYLDTYTSSGSYYNVAGLKPVRLSNPDFAWETNTKFEAAIELGFSSDRVLLEGNYYRNRSSNQLIGFSLPPTTGFTNIQGNLPATVENSGFEIGLNSSNVSSADFRWATSFNATFPRNELIEFPNLERSPTYADRLVVGEPLNIRKLFLFEGVNPQTGLYEFKDVNEDGALNSEDQHAIEFLGRKFYCGLNNSLTWKGFEFSFLFQYVEQTANNYISSFGVAPGGFSNQPIYVMDRWQRDGDNSEGQKFTTTSGLSAYSKLISTGASISDASFLRLKNLSISYHFPSGWLQRIELQECRLYILGQNLFTITKFKGLDPETGNSVLPPLSVLTGGIQISF